MREDGISLYGFLSSREKQCFELLISASGVGPSLAMKILSGMNVDDLVPAIRSGDLASLVKIPGVGKKTAERIVVELRDKLAAMETHETVRAASPAGPAEDVTSALINLGYEQRAAEAAVEEARRGAKTVNFEALLKDALKKLTSPIERGARSGR
jgi:Holliday junction DNA helicase RuvA